jgi:RNA polymerase sigma factor (sigma-70 family)
MPPVPLRTFLRSLRQRVGQASDGLADAHLVERWVALRDEAALEVLVWRHGTAVLGLCRRLLRSAEDVEDAFQATFLALVRKAGSIGKRASVGSWLYKVAYRVSLRLRAVAVRRGCEILPDLDPPAPALPPETECRELRTVLDAEVQRLPEKLRAAFVLCCVEGLTHDEAAARLGCRMGTVSSRLTRARQRLRRGLLRRGVAPPAGALAALLAPTVAPAEVPAPLVVATMKAAVLWGSGQGTAGAGAVRAASVAKGVLREMVRTRVKRVMLGLVLLGLGLAGTGAMVLARRTSDGRPDAGGPAALPAKGPARPDREKGEGAAEEQDLVKIGDRLCIKVSDTLPGSPIEGVHRVEPSGKVALGPGYGRVRVAGMTLEQAEVAIRDHLATILRSSQVLVTRYDPLDLAPERGATLEERVAGLEKEVRRLRAALQELQKKQRD